MKRLQALLCAFACMTLTGCSLLDGLDLGLDLAEPLPEPPAEEEELPEEEPEGSKALTLIFAHEIDENREDLLEAARQLADSKGYTLSAVETLGRPDLQQRFLVLARDAGEQAVLLELVDPAAASEAVQQAGEMAVIFVDVEPESSSALGRRAIYVGNSIGEGEPYLRLTGRTAVHAADNLIRGEAADTDTELKLSGHRITVPADGVLPE